MAQESNQISYLQTLSQAGLTTEQANIYEVLLKNGALPASKIHQKTPFKRGLVYKLLDQLQESGLVVKHDSPGKVATFEPAHPLKLKELAEKKEEQAKNAQIAIGSIFNSLVLDYNAISEKPGIKVYEGIIGIENVYQDVLANARSIKIFASNLDSKNTQIAQIIQDQAKKQARLGIKAQALTSSDPNEEHVITDTSALGIEFRRINNFEIPSQIIIYKNTVAISSLTNELITTVIENEAIAKSFEIIFDLLWSLPVPQEPGKNLSPTL